MSLRAINFFLMFGLIVLEVCSLVVNIITIKNCCSLNNKDDFRQENIISSSLSLIQEIISIISIIIFGIHSLYFKIFRRMLWFILFSVTMIILYMGIMITTYIYQLSHEGNQDEKLQEVLKLKKFLVYLCIIKSLFYLVCTVITCKERTTIIREIDESPFNMVDEGFTEQMYKNIIDHSLNPNNKNTREEFSRYTLYSKEKGKNRSLKSVPFSINSSYSGSNVGTEKDLKEPLNINDKQ